MFNSLINIYILLLISLLRNLEQAVTATDDGKLSTSALVNVRLAFGLWIKVDDGQK